MNTFTIRVSQPAKFVIGLITASSVFLPIVIQQNSVNAASLIIPSTTVDGFDSVDGSNVLITGPSFTVTNNFLPTDTISLNVSGTIDLANNVSGGYITNAAGILVQPSSIGGKSIGTVLPHGSTYYGALSLGNSTLGFHQLFVTNTANGLGNTTNPPTNLSFTNTSLASIFGSGLTSGTVLQFQIEDTDTGNNSGAYVVNGSINSASTAVPEPFTIIGTLIGGTVATRLRKKLKATAE